MADDPNQARAALDAEAARLAARRVADEQSLDAAKNRHAERERQKSLPHPGNLRAAHSRGLYVWGAVILFIAALFVGISAVMGGEDSDKPAQFTFERLALPGLLCVGGLAILSHRFTAIGRQRRWRASLPFPIHDYEEVLGIGLFITNAVVTVQFRDTAINSMVLSELVVAKLPESVVSAHGTRGIQINPPRLGAESANWPLANWMRTLVDKVLVGVHAGYAIESITLAAIDTTEFYIPSGD